ncbi:methyl-accepting chemotaxis protein [Vogesella sp. XCS3]|uniref:methyl-accepting chemotaxis protein n=1 Tax=Vogesella sp. XCS3 TaxID=2877939 RepID=UPI001D09D6B8|nr:methyl-accepting chemotaxis protein [Vogesella sp. XCS3]UDM18277.1 methyl-accepting chemotaxis protein [Vogesella sp. XCS3]
MFGLFKQKEASSAKDEEIHQLRQMLDCVDNLIMLADTTPDNKIIYMNKTARELLSQHRAAMNQKFRPGVDVEKAFEHSIHQFHTSPERIRGILQDLASGKLAVHKAMIPVGNITFETKIFPIWRQGNNRELLCFMASFRDVSSSVIADKLAAETANRRQFLEERVGEISQNMQAMSATIENVAVQTASASESAEVMLRESRHGVAIVDETSKSMKTVADMVRSTADSLTSLGQRSEAIGQIVNVIKDIADQTNLLALNAAIEAARAGEMGRGFAVVADEVRKLAERTTAATQQIGGMIKDIQQDVQQNVSATEQSRQQVAATESDFQRAEAALIKIVEEVNQMRDFVVQIAEASEEQAATSQDISDKLGDIARG